ncbi:hypothetical protein [Qipengyuania huizhouensis]|uniref:hypothetical protein n=1 Tax=Qipengyuania huizhouensis TaxID=2867245 RepID=UPI001C86E651|nr:hypothetical protein [Qipengyuania huizhouensis]MBX7461748.1 hypothetical protein [Qipengyuania huizhouensis]
MRLLLLPTALIILLGACSPQSPAQSGDALSSSAPGAGEVPQAVDLAGYWRVAGIDGAPFEASYGIALSADAQRIWWEPECARQYREYSISGSRFVAPVRSNDGEVVCEIGYPEELPEIWSALEAADTIERTPENGVLISGNDRSVLLFSQ